MCCFTVNTEVLERGGRHKVSTPPRWVSRTHMHCYQFVINYLYSKILPSTKKSSEHASNSNDTVREKPPARNNANNNRDFYTFGNRFSRWYWLLSLLLLILSNRVLSYESRRTTRYLFFIRFGTNSLNNNILLFALNITTNSNRSNSIVCFFSTL